MCIELIVIALYFFILVKVTEVPQIIEGPEPVQNGGIDEGTLVANRMKLAQKMGPPKKKAPKP